MDIRSACRSARSDSPICRYFAEYRACFDPLRSYSSGDSKSPSARPARAHRSGSGSHPVDTHGRPAEHLVEPVAIESSRTLHALLLRFVQVFNTQVAATAMSNGDSVIGQRLARWLLMCHDRIDGDELPLTHEFLSIMLAVRRAGVTEALHLLEGAGIIKARRALISILDRERLDEMAGDSYGQPEAEYERLIPKPGSPTTDHLRLVLAMGS